MSDEHGAKTNRKDAKNAKYLMTPHPFDRLRASPAFSLGERGRLFSDRSAFRAGAVLEGGAWNGERGALRMVLLRGS